MRILLISSNTAVSPYPVYPLGAGLIAGVLTNAGHEVKQFDYLQQSLSIDAMEREIRLFEPELIGISVRNIDNVNLLNEQHYIGIVKDMVKKIREVSASKVILGGAGFSLIPDLILRETGADYGVIGEGESLILDFVRGAAKGVYPAEKVIGPEKMIAGKDIPSALFDEALMEFYLGSGSIIPIQTKRGCNFKCAYCSYPLLEGSNIRQREPSTVVDDIERLTACYRGKFVFFVDSVFNDDEGAYVKVIEEMIRRRVKVPWTGFFRPTGLTCEIVGMMKETGLAAAEVGSDAATDQTLTGMRKGFLFRDIIECNELFLKHDIATAHYFMFGGPGETKETVREGIDNISKLERAIIFVFMGIRILPRTSLADLAVAENMISSEDGLLVPRYYISTQIDRKWLEATLTQAFSNMKNCIFPPDSGDERLHALHKMGFAGPLWDMLLRTDGKRRRTHDAK